MTAVNVSLVMFRGSTSVVEQLARLLPGGRGAASLAARLMSAAERSSIRFASLNSWGLIGRGLRITPLPSRSARMRNAAIRPNGLSLAGIRYHGANFVDVSSNARSLQHSLPGGYGYENPRTTASIA